MSKLGQSINRKWKKISIFLKVMQLYCLSHRRKNQHHGTNSCLLPVVFGEASPLVRSQHIIFPAPRRKRNMREKGKEKFVPRGPGNWNLVLSFSPTYVILSFPFVFFLLFPLFLALLTQFFFIFSSRVPLCLSSYLYFLSGKQISWAWRTRHYSKH